MAMTNVLLFFFCSSWRYNTRFAEFVVMSTSHW